MKINIILLLLSLLAWRTGSGQLLPESELEWVEVYNPETLKMANPDSVFSFEYWGYSYDLGEDESDPNFSASDLLRCRNLQKLVLNDIDATEVVENLNQFPLLQHLYLRDVKSDLDLQMLYALEELKYVNLEDISFVELDAESLRSSKIHTIMFNQVDANCTEEDVCELRFDYFPRLRSLSIYNSNITDLTHLKSCSNLEELDIYECENLTSISILGLNKLKHLRIREIYSCENFPEGASDLDSITEVEFGNNGFAVDMDVISNWSQLESMALHGCEVVGWGYIGNFSKLSYLSANACTFDEDFSALAACKDLKHLDLSGCELTDFPLPVSSLSNLLDLDLSNNAIVLIPNEISQMKSLTTLRLNFNPIKTVEVGAFNLPALNTLDLAYCAISQLPPLNGGLVNLVSLDLTGDSLTDFPSDWLNLKNLGYLNLSFNSLNQLPKSGWEGLSSIYSVNLGHNSLTKLPAGFWSMTNLGSLDLQYNQLKALPTKFSKMINLTSITLSGNKHIKYPKKLEKLPLLMEVYIREDDFTEKEYALWHKKLGDVLQVGPW